MVLPILIVPALDQLSWPTTRKVVAPKPRDGGSRARVGRGSHTLPARRDLPFGPTVLTAAPMQLCEVLCKQLLRRWRVHPRDLRHRTATVARSCNLDGAVRAEQGDRMAIAWMMLAMHWRGISHPVGLLSSPLHPPTGLVRWMMTTSQSVAGDADAVVRALHWTLQVHRSRAVNLAKLLMRGRSRSGRLVLRPQLLADEYWKHGESGVLSHLYYVRRQKNQ